MKTSRFNNLVIREDGYLIHNTLNGNILKVYNKRLHKFLDGIQICGNNVSTEITDTKEKELFDKLVELNMIIDDNVNELNISNYKYYSKNNHTLNIYMIPTMQCNFRCPYCYEEHENKTMTSDIIDKTIKMVLNQIQEKKYEKILISWFGGEPLLKYDLICDFMHRLKIELPDNVALSGQMTTNGYLLSPERFQKLLEHNILSYQITVDGLSDTHNKTRFLIGNQPTWDTIIRNLQFINTLNSSYSILLRTNITVEMMKDLNVWLEFLAKEFGTNKKIMYHFETVKNLGGEDSSFHYDLNKNEDPMSEVFEIASQKGLNLAPLAHRLIHSHYICYAADPHALVVDYDGKLKKCTVQLNEPKNHVGDIQDDGSIVLNEERFSWWTYYDVVEKCKQCSIYPICRGKKCPSAYYSEESCEILKNIYKATLQSVV